MRRLLPGMLRRVLVAGLAALALALARPSSALTRLDDLQPGTLAGSRDTLPAPGVQLSEVLFQCVDGKATQPFVELGSDRDDARFAPGLQLESYAHDGARLQTVPLDFGPRTGDLWDPGTGWLVAGSSLRDLSGNEYAPDTRVSPEFDPRGGSLVLVQVRSNGARVALDSLRFGPGGVPLPPPGRSLQRDAGGWVSGHAMPRHVTGGAGFSDCQDLCPLSAVEIDSLRFEGPFPGPWAVGTETGQAIVDNAAGWIIVQVEGAVPAMAEWTDEFVAGGAPAGSPVQLHLVVGASLDAPKEVCTDLRCRKGQASLDVEVPGHHAGYGVVATGERDSTLDLSFTVAAAQPFRLTVRGRVVLTAGTEYPPPYSTMCRASASIQLRHSDPYVTLTSCKGFGAIALTSTTGVEPPAGSGATRLAVRQVTPNPTRGASRLTLVLPRSGDVQVDVLDVAGRRVAGREWGELGVGEHVLPLAGPGELPPGFYLVRVRQGGESATTRVLVLR